MRGGSRDCWIHLELDRIYNGCPGKEVDGSKVRINGAKGGGFKYFLKFYLDSWGFMIPI